MVVFGCVCVVRGRGCVCVGVGGSSGVLDRWNDCVIEQRGESSSLLENSAI